MSVAHAPNAPVWRRKPVFPAPTIDQVEVLPLVIVGAGPVGLTLALDLGRRGHRVVVLNRLDFVAAGSRAICFSKRSLEIFDRLGIGDAVAAQGVRWDTGKIFWGSDADPVYQFAMIPAADQKRPAFVNIQQYHVEEHLLDALAALPNVEVRWGHEVIDVVPMDGGAIIDVRVAAADYRIETDWLLACDGSRSTVRNRLGLDFDDQNVEDNFLVADIRMEFEHPSERWFWFDPPFNPGRSVLLHKQSDNVWRLDFQVGRNVDRQASADPANVGRFVRAMLGDERAFSIEWSSVYTFQCRRMAHFVHDHVIFAGDSAHLVSPFGARGCNSGLADADNLAWKLDLVVGGHAPEALLQSYDAEATAMADENIAVSTRSADFMSPRSAASSSLRDAVLELARSHAFARPFVNSGRMSTALPHSRTVLSTPDVDPWIDGVAPGAPILDAPVGKGWLTDRVGNRFVVLTNGWKGPTPADAMLIDVGELGSAGTVVRERYDLDPGSAYLFRPDQYVAARWRMPSPRRISNAIARASGASHP